jgi:hypothetical protein
VAVTDGTEPLFERLQPRTEHSVTYLGDHLVLVRFVAVKPGRPLDIRILDICLRGRAGCQPKMSTALATTSAMAATETADCSIIIIFAQRVSVLTSPAAKEMAFVNDRYK